MGEEEASSSLLTRTHFSRAVCYRLGSVNTACLIPNKHELLMGATQRNKLSAPESLRSRQAAATFSHLSSSTPTSSSNSDHDDLDAAAAIEGDFSFPSPFSSSPTNTSSWPSDSSQATTFLESSCSFSPSAQEDQNNINLQAGSTSASHGSCRFSLRSMLSRSLPITSFGWSFSNVDSCSNDWHSAQSSPKASSSTSRSVSPKGSQNSSPRGSFRMSSKDSSPRSTRSPVNRQSGMQRVPSWSQLLSKAGGGERAVLSAKRWMVDMSQLLLGERFACGNHSRLYKGIYRENAVAVKVIRQPDQDCMLADRLEQIFMQEITALSCLQHRNIVKFFAACKKPPVLCVVMEYLSGGCLRSFLRKREGNPLPATQIARMASDIASGMEYLHMKGIIHRDLKSENLVLGEDGCVKVVDLGVSCFESNCGSRADDMGTYRWMAPEMLHQKPHTRKVDTFSFGIVLWELVTTRIPYDEMSAVQAAFCVLHKEARPPIPADCPAALADLMQSCWHTEPQRRPEFWEIMRALASYECSLVVKPCCDNT